MNKQEKEMYNLKIIIFNLDFKVAPEQITFTLNGI